MWRMMWDVKRIWVSELGLYQVDLADITGIREGTISDIMNGVQDSISLEQLARICEACHRDISEVLVLIKDSDMLDGEERNNAIMEAVDEVRRARVEKNAKRRERRRINEERRIREAVEKALREHGLLLDGEATSDKVDADAADVVDAD